MLQSKKEKPSVDVTANIKKIQIFELLETKKAEKTVDVSANLKEVQKQLSALTEQEQLAKAFSVALIDGQHLETIITETSKAYNQALEQLLIQKQKSEKRSIYETKAVIEQSSQQLQQILDILNQINTILRAKNENDALEREVLFKLKDVLSRRNVEK